MCQFTIKTKLLSVFIWLKFKEHFFFYNFSLYIYCEHFVQYCKAFAAKIIELSMQL